MAAGCSGSGLSLSYNNYDNWNTNTNCSPHLSDVFAMQALPLGKK